MTYRLFAVAWAACLLFDLSNRGMTGNPSQIVATVAAAVALLAPEAPLLLAIAAVAHAGKVAVSLMEPPGFFYVHWYVDLAVNGAIVLAYASVAARRRAFAVSDTEMAAALGPVGRALGVLVLFAAGTAKLNTTFLDPDLSCASAFYLVQRRATGFGWLPDAEWARMIAIGLTVAAECVAPIALWSARTRPAGLAVAAGFLALLSVNPVGHLYEFACPVSALLALFASPGQTAGAVSAVIRAVGGTRWLRIALSGLALAWVGGMVAVGDGPEAAFTRAVACRVVALTGTVALCVTVGWPAEDRRQTDGFALLRGGARLAWLVPVLVGANELTTYLGYPHNLSLTMASDLRAIHGRGNHVLLRPPRLPGNAPVTVLASSNAFLAAVRRENAAVNWLSVRVALAWGPNTFATVSIDGGEPTRFGPSATDPRVSPLPFSTWLVYSEPPAEQRCHHWVLVSDPAAPKLHGVDAGRAQPATYVRSGPP